MTRVRFTTSIAGPGFAFSTDDEAAVGIDVSADQARAWAAAGICEAVAPGRETATAAGPDRAERALGRGHPGRW